LGAHGGTAGPSLAARPGQQRLCIQEGIGLLVGKPPVRSRSGVSRRGLRCFHCGSAFFRFEPGEGPGLLLRRHRGGDPQRSQPRPGTPRLLARSFLPPAAGRARQPRIRASPRRRNSARRQRPEGREPTSHHGPVSKRREWLPDLEPAFRPRNERHLRHPGRNCPPHC